MAAGGHFEKNFKWQPVIQSTLCLFLGSGFRQGRMELFVEIQHRD